MKILLTIFLLSLLIVNAYSAEPILQSIRGEVISAETMRGLVGVTIVLPGTKFGAKSNSKGEFKIENIPVGRYNVIAKMIGYEIYSNDIILNSGKQLYLKIELKEKYIDIDSVVVTASKNNFVSINESALISATVFSIDDVNRYAGSRGDPARMVQNYAGVIGANDNRNDIIIRGGSPVELLWKLDGLEIPNPNHFATQGATGGPVNAINTLLLDNSDFLTGAFPANYYGKLSGVFDLNTRKGNDEKYEFLGQFGFNGFELGAEGPIQKSSSSFIANYRYSFLTLLKDMGMDFGVSGVPEYQDGTLKLDFSLNDNNKLSFTGLFGISDIFINESEGDEAATGDFDINNGTDIYAMVVNWKNLMSEQSYSVMTAGVTYSQFRTSLDSLTSTAKNTFNKFRWYESNSGEGLFSIKYDFFTRLSAATNINLGLEYKNQFYDLHDKRIDPNIPAEQMFNVNESGASSLFAGHITDEYKGIKNIQTSFGVASQYFMLNKKYTIEPRISMQWNFAEGQSVNIGWGKNHQLLPLVVLLSNTDNEKLDFMQSLHYIVGYSCLLTNDLQVKIEAYYKDLSSIPIETDSNSTWSFLNSGANYGAVSYESNALKSDGKGRTYGAELSLLKHFANNYYLTATGSYIRQEYSAADKKWRFGAFDNRFVYNILSGYDLKISNDYSMEFSFKYTNAGGGPYTPIDLAKSEQESRTNLDDARAFELRNPNYSRFDIRIDFRQSFVGFALTSYVSLENVFDTKNVLDRSYRPNTQTIKENYQMGRFFVGGIKIEF